MASHRTKPPQHSPSGIATAVRMCALADVVMRAASAVPRAVLRVLFETIRYGFSPSTPGREGEVHLAPHERDGGHRLALGVSRRGPRRASWRAR
jgi:hypothetical protein